jgi:trimeric autotransporter adhesin
MKTKEMIQKVMMSFMAASIVFSLLPLEGYSTIPQKINYQGYLTDSTGSPVNGTVSMVFSIYDVSTGGTPLWSEIRNVELSDGVFSVNLGEVTSLGLVFDTQYYLGVKVGVDPEMVPRMALTSTPYAIRASYTDNVEIRDNAVTSEKIASGQVVKSINSLKDEVTLSPGTNITITPSGNTLTISSVQTNTEVDPQVGTLIANMWCVSNAEGTAIDCNQAAPVSSGHNHDSVYWKLGGNSESTPGTQFLGTTDNQAFELKVYNSRVLRMEPKINSPNFIGGHSENNVTSGAEGATISGGGKSGGINLVTDNWGTIGGGYKNQVGDDAGTTADRAFATVGGGFSNTASGYHATIGGGNQNTASGYQAAIAGGSTNEANASLSTVGGGLSNLASGGYATVGGGNDNAASNTDATVGGGYQNIASGVDSTVGGGVGNQATGHRATVGGGWYNIASANASTIPGGADNVAQGAYSFAAGARAKANNKGCFVWSDASSATDTTCSDDNRWVARASGGVYFYTDSSLTTGSYIAPGSSGWQNVSDRNLKENITPVSAKNILTRISTIPITTWNFKGDNTSSRHIGPMAQDFYAAFRLGIEDRSINSIDADGIALAAIQGLHQLLKEKEARIDQLESLLSSLGQRLSNLETQFGGGVR